jgi:hypothetical protein
VNVANIILNPSVDSKLVAGLAPLLQVRARSLC